jgi:2-iminobutanoate/2-iminopropanoate deaminase
VGQTATEQAQRIIENLETVIEAAGYTLADIVKTTINLMDLTAFQEVNKVYETFFSGAFPARGKDPASLSTQRSPG